MTGSCGHRAAKSPSPLSLPLRSLCGLTIGGDHAYYTQDHRRVGPADLDGRLRRLRDRSGLSSPLLRLRLRPTGLLLLLIAESAAPPSHHLTATRRRYARLERLGWPRPSKRGC